MDEKFYLDDFELSLKEHVDQFKMVPSKKVWHGIYNDLHPGRRWPSVMVSLLLIFSIVFVGYINSHTDKKPADSYLQTPIAHTQDNNSVNPVIDNKKQHLSSKQTDQEKSNTGILRQVKENVANEHSTSFAGKEDRNSTTNKIKSSGSNMNFKTNGNDQTNISYGDGVATGGNNQVTAIEAPAKYKEDHSLIDKESIDVQKISGNKNSGIENTPGIINNIIQVSLFNPGIEISGISNTDKNINNSIPSLMGKYTAGTEINSTVTNADHSLNKKNELTAAVTVRKRNDKFSWVYYAGPYVSSVSLRGKPLKDNANPNISLSGPLPQVNQKDVRVLHNPAFGFEVGVQMNYSLASDLQLTAGAHITHSGYNIVSNLVHPTLSTLVLKDPSTGDIYARNFVTHYGDGTGMSTVTLNNYSYQISLPVGLQYNIWGNDKLQVNLAANVEPSFVIKADAFILSSDGKNYVNVPDLLRKWNFSGNFAPFVSFRSYKLKWNIGPDIRYQWLSTYQKSYIVKEHLIDYGIRVGISK